jgi:hypothetical protein
MSRCIIRLVVLLMEWGGSLFTESGSLDLMCDRTKSVRCVDLAPNGRVRLIISPQADAKITGALWRGFMPCEQYARQYYLPFCDDPNLDSP